MFNQKKYINSYIKDNYKTIKIRIRKDDSLLLEKINSVENINKYILDLIKKDISQNRVYNFIDDDIKIDFEVSKTMEDLLNKAMIADFNCDYGLYMNIADAIDTLGKNESKKHLISNTQWQKLTRRYHL